MWVVVAAAISATRQAAIEHATTESKNLAAAIAGEVARGLDRFAESMEAVARRMRADPSGGSDIYAWAQEIPLLAGGTVEAAVIDPHGKVTGTSLDPHAPPVDLSQAEHFRVHA